MQSSRDKPSGGESFPPQTLRQYALLADGERGAVIGPHGDIALLCLPRWHDDAVFSSLIGGGGHYAVTPSERYVWGGHYERATLIWRSRWVTTTAEIECREALALPAEAETAVILRRIEALSSDAAVDVVLDPRPAFGSHEVPWRSTADGVWEGEAGGLRFRWSGAPQHARRRDGAIGAQVHLKEGQTHDLVLELSTGPLGALPRAAALWEKTEQAWASLQPRLAASVAPSDVLHSHAVLRGMTSASGGMVAAATMSMPERSDAGRNYDYRYAWIRDQCFAGEAAARAWAWDLLDSAVNFVSARLLDDGPDLKPAYTVTGGRVPDERSLDLDGYPGGKDKVGNWVNEQFQLDTLGEALVLFASASRADRIDSDHVKAAYAAVDAIEKRRSDCDSGIWELEERHWAHSRLMCAAGLRQFAAEHRGPRAERWVDLADDLVDEVRGDCSHPSGRWQRAPDDDRLDAALLIPTLRGAVPPDDPRAVATWQAVRRELTDDGYVYRFRHDDRPMDQAEGAFVLCGFHLALACRQQGDDLAAVRYFERNRSTLGPPGLFTEEFDVVQRQLRGNFPQSFAHALMIETAVDLAPAVESATPSKEPSEHPEEDS